MINFQGSGFSVELPETSVDASAYTFLLPAPTGGGFAPFMTIRSEKTNSTELEAYVREQIAALQQSVEKFELVSFSAGQHQGLDVVLSTVAWGPTASRIGQVQAHYLVRGEKQNKIYCLTGIDLLSNFSGSQPIFNATFKTFTPNELQMLDSAP